MKVISVILSLLILTMVLLPCADEPVFNETASIEINDQHEDANHHDLCSPFCTCHCCHSHVTADCAFCLGTFNTLNSTPSEHLFPLLSRISFSIWDPPPFNESNPIA